MGAIVAFRNRNRNFYSDYSGLPLSVNPSKRPVLSCPYQILHPAPFQRFGDLGLERFRVEWPLRIRSKKALS